jgi:hypothetical protein
MAILIFPRGWLAGAFAGHAGGTHILRQLQNSARLKHAPAETGLQQPA